MIKELSSSGPGPGEGEFFFVSNELKWPKLAIFGFFEGHRSPKMPFFTGIRPGSTSAHLNHEFHG